MNEKLESLEPNSEVFVDANIFLYSIFDHPTLKPSCESFLTKIESNEYNAVTSPLVLNEVVYKLMLAEVANIHNLDSDRKALRLIRRNPDVITDLSQTWGDYSDIKEYPITIKKIDEKAMDLAVEFCEEYKLLTSDATHIAIMKQNNITNLASNDSDFERVGWINLHKPSES